MSLRDLSLWHDTLPTDDQLAPRPALPGDTEVDVAIVGAGYTGLWTAYYLRRRNPDMRIAVVESQVAGFGASGRNGGWCSALLPMGFDAMAATHGKDGATRLQRAMNETVDEIGAVAAREAIDCHFAKGGTFRAARNPAHVGRMQDEIAEHRAYGFGEDDIRWLDRHEAQQLVNVTHAEGGIYTPHCAAIHPARLVRGLAHTVEASGVRIFEHTKVLEIQPRRLVTDRGVIRADHIVRATEGFTPMLPGQARQVIPIYSLMIATEPLPDEFWQATGLGQRATFNDGRHMIVYGQRTADNRFAFGGRGAWYHWGSAIKPSYDRNSRVHSLIHDTLREMFPAIGEAAITHRWGGPVGAARDWWCHANFDRTSGLASAGGYVGDGVGTTNLSGRTLADLITNTPSELATLPWVGHRSRKWEPEPLRFLGINTMAYLPIGADRHEERHGTASKWREAIMNRLLGH